LLTLQYLHACVVVKTAEKIQHHNFDRIYVLSETIALSPLRQLYSTIL